jgi:hypothetical protein
MNNYPVERGGFEPLTLIKLSSVLTTELIQHATMITIAIFLPIDGSTFPDATTLSIMTFCIMALIKKG